MSDLKVISKACGAQTVIFLSSMASSAVICLMPGMYRDHVTSMLMALGAACLAGDAIFHLMPHALEADSHHSHHGSTSKSSQVVLWRSSLIVCSLYFFYLFHLFLYSIEEVHSHTHGIPPPESHGNFKLLSRESDSTDEQNEYGNKRALIWMMVFSGALHAACDGVAIGAAFSSSATDGLSTSLAVLFHEVPHGVGAFAIFLSFGVRIKRALYLLSTRYILSYVGVVIGVLLGASLSGWIFAVIAGMFLYIALAEMIPEMYSSLSLRADDRRYFMLFQNCGLILGFSIMMTLAAFHGKIRGVLL
ncbi:metal cation symporter ZIP14-like isoform X2 [Acropora palmata]